MASTAPKVRTSRRLWERTLWTSPAIGPATSFGQASRIRFAASSANGASAVSRIRNGKSDVSADSATWLAIAQPSCRTKRWNASDNSSRKMRGRNTLGPCEGR